MQTHVGLRTVPSDGYGRTIDGQVTVRFNRLPSVKSAQQIPNGYGDGRSTVDGSRRLSNQSIMILELEIPIHRCAKYSCQRVWFVTISIWVWGKGKGQS
jgi:hypothetical protein